MKYKIQDIKLPDKAARVKKTPEKKVLKVESREVRDYSWGMWLLAGISVLFLVFSLSLVFARAKVTVFAKTAVVPVRTDFNLTKNGGLVFEVARAAGEETKTITSDEAISFERKARGVVILYNTTNQDQKLLIETRLSTPDGKIFKTDKAITIPKGAVAKPGTVEVGATAEKAGEEYNVGLVDFKIVGFKGTPKYDTFYGRSKESLGGGLVGERYTVSAEAAEASLADLKTALREKLTRQLAAQAPADYFILPDTSFIDKTTANFESETPEITIKATGELFGVILNKNNLGQELAKRNIADVGETPVAVSNLNELVFTVDNKSALAGEPSDVRFAVSGDAKVVWGIDAARLAERLAGSRRKDFTTILADFPAIEKAELRVLPFWKRTLPASPKHIRVSLGEKIDF
jgi:hypothetical protein